MAIYPQYDRLLSLPSVHHAIRAERLLCLAGISIVALPTPREIDINCGQCLLFQAKDETSVLHILQHGQVKWSKLFSRNAGTRYYAEIAKSGKEDAGD